MGAGSSCNAKSTVTGTCIYLHVETPPIVLLTQLLLFHVHLLVNTFSHRKSNSSEQSCALQNNPQLDRGQHLSRFHLVGLAIHAA